MGKTEEDWNGLKFGFLKTVQPNSFSKLIPAACNFINNAQETYLFVSDLWYLSFTCNFCAYFKFHSDWGRVIGKIKQTELDCHDTAPSREQFVVCLRDRVKNKASKRAGRAWGIKKRKERFPSFPSGLPLFHFFGFSSIFRAAKTGNPVPRSFFPSKRHGK